jgi:hypothetical protein
VHSALWAVCTGSCIPLYGNTYIGCTASSSGLISRRFGERGPGGLGIDFSLELRRSIKMLFIASIILGSL